MTVLRVTARMSMPIATRHAVQLDAVLVQAHPDIGVASKATPESELVDPGIGVHRLRHGGESVYLCSQWVLPAEARRDVGHIVKRKTPRDLDQLEGSWNPGLGPGKNRCVPMPLVVTPHVTWLVVGRRQAVKKLLRYVRRLGGLRAHGYGDIQEWEVVALDGVLPERVLMTADGRAARHLPASWVAGDPPTDSGAWRPPYWHPYRIGDRVPAGTECELIPAVRGLVAACR